MKKITLLILSILFSVVIYAQNDDEKDVSDYASKKNIVKTNITSLIFRNFEFQYERVFNKTMSANLNIGFIPKGKVPMQGIIENYVDDAETMDYVRELEISQTNIIAEVRFYLGKGYGKGFYLAPFYDYSSYSVDNFNIEYEDDEAIMQYVSSDGSVGASTFGLLIGTQYNLGKNLVLDWWIVGPHYGFGSGDIVGKTTQTLSQNEQQSLKKEIDNLDIPMVDVKSNVSANGVEIKLDGPWAGLRAGVSLGYRF